MTLSISVNGVPFTNFQRARVVRSIETLCGAFSFVTTADNTNRFPVKKRDLVEILADGNLILTGFVDDTPVTYDAQTHSINVTGRSILQDVVDNTVSSTKEFTAGINLTTIIRTVLNDFGLTNIKLINNAGTIKNFSDSEISSAEVGQNAFEFLELYGRKRQVLLNDDSAGNFILARASTDKLPTKLQMLIGRQSDNNIKSASFNNSDAERYYKYTVQSQLNPFDLDFGFGADTVSNQSATVYDTYIRKTRQLEINSEESIESFSARDRAKWEANIRRSRAFNYKAVVQGHSISTVNGLIPWECNKLVPVVDDFADISADLLIKQVEFVYGIETGSITNLTMAQKDAFTLQVEQDQRTASRSKTGEAFTI